MNWTRLASSHHAAWRGCMAGKAAVLFTSPTPTHRERHYPAPYIRIRKRSVPAARQPAVQIPRPAPRTRKEVQSSRSYDQVIIEYHISGKEA